MKFNKIINFQEIWDHYEINTLFSTKVYFLKSGVSSKEIYEFLECAEDVSKYEKMKEFGVKIEIFGEEMMMKVLVVNEKKGQFQIKGEEKEMVRKILNFMLFLFCN